LYASDENGRPILTPLLRATYRIDPTASSLVLNETQIPPKLAGEFTTDAEISSYRYEPETAFVKLSTDVVLLGHAHAPNDRTVVLDVGLKAGNLQKIVRVHGERYWVKTGGQVLASPAQPFTRVPLVYERAFGGWDKSHKDPANWTLDPNNPVGVGFGNPLRFVEEGKVRLPNLEDPQRPVRRYGEPVPAAAFGFISPDWASRAKLAGTYDAAWERERKPLLPKDFDRRHFNSASAGLIAPSYFSGDEEVVIVNASPTGPLRFRLPGLPPHSCTVALTDGTVTTVRLNLDTVIIDTDAMLVSLLWRSCIGLPTGPHDVESLGVEIERPTAKVRA
jgi:hypothetical protein